MCKVMIASICLVLVPVALASDPLEDDLRSYVLELADKTGVGMSLGFVDSTHDFGVAAGPRNPPPCFTHDAKAGNLTTNDTYNLGSATKTYSTISIMRLVEQGKISLTDKAHKYTDVVMKKMWNTTFEEVLGPMAANVTVHHLISMQSGLGDFNMPDYNTRVLTQETIHCPLEDLQYVANYTEPDMCKDGMCTWTCAPGTCTAYSNANFILVGLVLLAHAPAGKQTWQQFELTPFLGPDFAALEFHHTAFPTIGKLSTHGLTSAASRQGTEIFLQDASIMGFCLGFTNASPMDVARMYWNLLGAPRKFVSAASLATMMNFTHAENEGWEQFPLAYGAGLELQTVTVDKKPFPPPLSGPSAAATFLGHDGSTFGFLSNQGYFPALNASIVFMINQDQNDQGMLYSFGYSATCHIAELVAKHKGQKADLRCGTPGAPPAPPPPTAGSVTALI